MDSLSIMQHCLGLDKYGQGTMWRNHFVGSEDSCYWSKLQEFVSKGFMTMHGPSELYGGSNSFCFCATPEGKAWVVANSPKPPKLTRSQARYRAFLRSDCGLSFGEWLKLK